MISQPCFSKIDARIIYDYISLVNNFRTLTLGMFSVIILGSRDKRKLILAKI